MLETNFKPFPVLESSRLLLRQVSAADKNEVFSLRADPRVMKYIDRPIAGSMEDALELIQKIDDGLINNNGITWAITLKGSQQLVGTIGYWRIDKEHYRAEIGYLLHPDLQRKGITQEAITVILNYGFEIMKLHSVEANVNPGNEASIKLLEKNNFKREAYFKENYFYQGRFLDSAIYSLLTPFKGTRN